MNGKRFITGALAIAMVLSGGDIGRSATVVLKSHPDPIRGFLVSEDDRQIVIRVRQSDGSFAERTIARTDVDLIHRPVEVERLTALTPEKPTDYRDYAEELAEKRVDPEARELSLRLFAIAAYLDPANLGRSSLLGMTALAESPEEERRYRALAYLLDPEHDRGVLKTVNPTTGGGRARARADGNQDAFVLGAIRGLELLRKGRTQEAGQQLRREGMADILAPFADVITYDALLTACRGRVQRGPAAPAALAEKLVRLELMLLGETIGDEMESAPAATSWLDVTKTERDQPARPLSIETITPFDPTRCVFRDGEWVAP